MSENIAINSLSKDDLKKYIIKLGEKDYRAKQLWRWLYVNGVKSFKDMSDIGVNLRDKLSSEVSFDRLLPNTHQVSEDGTQKWLFALKDKREVETVFIPEADRGTLCISSQVGCTLSCSFCHTGTMALVRNLTADEIVGQVLSAKDSLLDWGLKNRRITNIVFMGMGEPLYNYQEVTKAIKILLDNEGLCYSRRKITLSTSGVVPIIEKLKKQLDVSLAISLHAVNDKLRNELVPINKKWPIKELLSVLEVYPGVNNARRITFEYVMLDGINDSIAEAKKLVSLLKPIHAKVNLIPFNPWPGSIYKCSSAKTIKNFADEICNNGGITATVRHARGQDILAACGQLKSNSERIKREKVKNINAA
ncbi:23S rRNA (adenine(2503)-C(2))-methyltransferase RlmN [Alphaproteobacteria bacterium]|jgi:23S rRNA (adenine2503-C2)-methyltransferase|nr:23S rRNA (adenine(2503)-C(2))-methyltransferase RlmN [Alphaproteobacteria bacterium]